MLSDVHYSHKENREREGENEKEKGSATRRYTTGRTYTHNTRTLPHNRYITRIVSFNVKIK